MTQRNNNFTFHDFFFSFFILSIRRSCCNSSDDVDICRAFTPMHKFNGFPGLRFCQRETHARTFSHTKFNKFNLNYERIDSFDKVRRVHAELNLIDDWMKTSTVAKAAASAKIEMENFFLPTENNYIFFVNWKNKSLIFRRFVRQFQRFKTFPLSFSFCHFLLWIFAFVVNAFDWRQRERKRFDVIYAKKCRRTVRTNSRACRFDGKEKKNKNRNDLNQTEENWRCRKSSKATSTVTWTGFGGKRQSSMKLIVGFAVRTVASQWHTQTNTHLQGECHLTSDVRRLQFWCVSDKGEICDSNLVLQSKITKISWRKRSEKTKLFCFPIFSIESKFKSFVDFSSFHFPSHYSRVRVRACVLPNCQIILCFDDFCG